MKAYKNATEAITHHLQPIEGKRVLDIGCGSGTLSQPLGDAGLHWFGIDPNADISVKNCIIGAAEELPYDNKIFEYAICTNSLHHVPIKSMDAALSESARILMTGGRLLVIEPLATGALSQVIAVIDDETQIRQAAQDALNRAVSMGLFRETAHETYTRNEKFRDFTQFCHRIIEAEPTRAIAITQNRHELELAFDHFALCESDRYILAQPMLLLVFQCN